MVQAQTQTLPPDRRLRPRPLPLQILHPLSIWLSWPAAWPNLSGNWPTSKPSLPNLLPLRARLERLLMPYQAVLSQPEAAAALQQAITTAAIERARRHIAAIRLYQLHPACRTLNDPPVIWQSGTTRLLDFGIRDSDTPVLIIPSLINRYHILDLDQDHSFVRQLAGEGFRPLVVDWGEPAATELTFSLTDYIQQRLIPILDTIAKETSGQKPHILGYCMGGNLALALAVLRPDLTRSLTLLATPWDFSSQHFTHPPDFQATLPLVQQLGYLSIDALQTLFSALQPEQAVAKFRRFGALDWDSPAARRFVLVEDWLNDGVPLPAKVAIECLAGWYGNNQPYHLGWRVGETVIDPRRITAPSYVVVAGADKIVPPASSQPLGKLLRRATMQQPPLGHVGLMASEKANLSVWQPLAAWLKNH